MSYHSQCLFKSKVKVCVYSFTQFFYSTDESTLKNCCTTATTTTRTTGLDFFNRELLVQKNAKHSFFENFMRFSPLFSLTHDPSTNERYLRKYLIRRKNGFTPHSRIHLTVASRTVRTRFSLSLLFSFKAEKTGKYYSIILA